MSKTKELLEDMHNAYDKMLKNIEVFEIEYYYGGTITRDNKDNTRL